MQHPSPLSHHYYTLFRKFLDPRLYTILANLLGTPHPHQTPPLRNIVMNYSRLILS